MGLVPALLLLSAVLGAAFPALPPAKVTVSLDNLQADEVETTAVAPISNAVATGGLASVTPAELRAAVLNLTGGPAGSILSTLPLTDYALALGDILRPDSSPTGIALAGAGGIIAVGAACAIATAGVCGVAIAIGALGFLLVSYLGGLWANNSDTQSAHNALSVILAGLGEAADVEALAVKNLVNALNLTEVAMEYEASAAALSQLPNATWNGPLDLTQSYLAQQLETVFAADEETLASITEVTAFLTDEVEGLQNGGSNYCPTDVVTSYPIGPRGSSLFGFPGGSGSGAESCGTTPSTWYLLEGEVQGFWSGYPLVTPSGNGLTFCGPWDDLPACPDMYFAPSFEPGAVDNVTVMDLSDSGGCTDSYTVSFIPSGNQKAPWVNISASHDLIDHTLSLNGSYQVAYEGTLASGCHLYAYFSMAIPVTQSTLTAYDAPTGTTAPAVYDMPGVAENSTAVAPGDFVPLADLDWVPSFDLANAQTTIDLWDNAGGCPCVNIYGGNTAANENGSLANAEMEYPSSTQANLGLYLWTLMSNAENVAHSYWAYLHYLGYYSIGAVTPACLILSPGSLFPPNLTPQELQNLTPTEIEELYYQYMYELAKDYNDTDGLNITNFCGAKVSPPGGWSTPLSFGTYAYGYVYLPDQRYANASGVLKPEYFAQPTSWAWSGVVDIMPTLHNYTIPLNTTWDIGRNSPVQVLAQPFLKPATKASGVGSGLIVNQTGPSWCNTHPGSANGCNVTGAEVDVSGFVNGNSTQVSGSAFPTDIELGGNESNVSVYLTACFTEKAGSNPFDPSYVETLTGVCDFDISTINTTGWTCSGSVVNNVCVPNPGCVLNCAPPPGGGGCDTGVSWLNGLVSDLAAPFTAIPILGAWACTISEVIVIVGVIILVLVAVVVVSRVGGSILRQRRPP